tara:strand:+ start:720 stop:1076 length:357 start_codon:yes stop_codon:yes gene_type:complete
MKKEIIINDNKTEVTLLLSLKKRIMARDPKMTVTTVMAKTMLENEKFKLDKCLKHDIINNHDANSKHDGTWTFSLVQELPAAKVTKIEVAEEILGETPPTHASTKKKTSRKRKTYKKQ